MNGNYIKKFLCGDDNLKWKVDLILSNSYSDEIAFYFLNKKGTKIAHPYQQITCNYITYNNKIFIETPSFKIFNSTFLHIENINSPELNNLLKIIIFLYKKKYNYNKLVRFVSNIKTNGFSSLDV